MVGWLSIKRLDRCFEMSLECCGFLRVPICKASLKGSFIHRYFVNEFIPFELVGIREILAENLRICSNFFNRLFEFTRFIYSSDHILRNLLKYTLIVFGTIIRVIFPEIYIHINICQICV